MTEPGRPLDVARTILARRAEAAGDARDWQEQAILSPLATVADMVCRIGDVGPDVHYRAEKSALLVGAALDVRRECLGTFLHARGVVDEERFDELDRADQVVHEVASAAGVAMSAIARHDVVYASQAAEIRKAARAFGIWAESVCVDAVPDPVE